MELWAPSLYQLSDSSSVGDPPRGPGPHVHQLEKVSV